MEKKRKLPARAARVESNSKKRTTTPPGSQTNTTVTSVPANVPPERTPLPTSIAPGKPLPTVTQPQSNSLSAKEYQSIPESGILSESLSRSRQRWTTEGIFEKYWTKVKKGKNTSVEPHGNPSKDSMVKLGTCTITVEPHIFEATIFTVKETNLRPKAPTQASITLPTLQYGPPGGSMPPTQLDETNYSKTSAYIPPISHCDEGEQKHKNAVGGRPTTVLSSNEKPIEKIPPQISAPNQTSAPSKNKSSDHPTEPVPAPKGSDPVIQMLAQKAATDQDLKDLMRTVANGQATPEQLKQFQNQIDDLARLHQIQQMPVDQPNPSLDKNKSGVAGQDSSSPPLNSLGSNSVAPVASLTGQNQSNSQALKCKGPTTSTKPECTGVVFEFAGGNGDRYSFPKYSILEQISGTNQVIVSFLIIRKGSNADSHNYNPSLDYYQPMTIRIHAHQSRQLEALQKAVESPEEVRRWMDKVMDECQRAEYVLLAMRLPREVESSAPIEGKNGTEKLDQINMQVKWVTTASTSTLTKSRVAKKMITEEERLQNCISSIAAAT
ncbi:unnamed protein product [Blumeria hordei]|uniref:SWR1-complex protein 3 domain-containing protein n=2 Tax=Blumeria hordei TaxID=2867405 RepID=A0A383UGC1_BLUHO|nr:hypothetical protein BGHDH14_bgh01817 [Blumeria hordei DH14]SZE99329.1 unnamed protein product [Blumeria hordei]